jgi:hypothetical protein
MFRHNSNPLLDAETVLVGAIQHGATRPFPVSRASGDVVELNTKLDAAMSLSFVVSHPGAATAVEAELLVAPLRVDGSQGNFVSVCKVAVPAQGGLVEARISGHDIVLDAADQPHVQFPAVAVAKALITPDTPAGLLAGLTATVPA